MKVIFHICLASRSRTHEPVSPPHFFMAWYFIKHRDIFILREASDGLITVPKCDSKLCFRYDGFTLRWQEMVLQQSEC
jgi:hypothetical protein